MLPRPLLIAINAALLLQCSYIFAAPLGQVDINHASLSELMHVPGITQVWAKRILRFRPYRTKFDLLHQGIVPSQLYYKIREQLVAHHNQH